MSATARDEAAPLLDREQEQSLLRSLLDEVATRGQALVLRGEPGVGKSRLLSDVRANGARAGHVGAHDHWRAVRSRSTVCRACISSSVRCAVASTSSPRFSVPRSMPLSA